MMQTILQADGLLLAKHIPATEAWGQGLNFFSEDPDFVQVGTWGYTAGKELLAHAHNQAPRGITHTQEVLYVRQGRLRADIFGVDDVKVCEVVCEAGDVLILLAGGHGYHILEDGTQVLEVKNGPYLGAERDRRRI
jgi:hypothetical protein